MKKAKQSRSQNSYSGLDVSSSECGSDDSDISEFDSDDSYNVSESGDSSNSESNKGFKLTNNPKRLKRKKDAMHSRKRIRLGNEVKNTSASWKKQCAALLDHIFQSEDAVPFRYPVNLMEYPDYRNIIHYPMDLSTVRRELNNNRYNTPMDFCKDMRLIFRNSRTYNTNKNSRIYSMTTRLSDMFEEHITYITDDWRWMPTKKFEEMLKNNQYVKNRGKPVAAQEVGVNVGASTSHVSSTVTRSLPSESSSENSGNTAKKVLNADFKSSPKISSSCRKSNKTGCNCTSDHPGSKTLQDLKKLFFSQEQCDVSIIVKGEEFQAHKAILIARSPVFASTFRNDMNEQVTGMVEIEDCDPSSFSDFLSFLYCGDVESISAENVFSLFTAAVKYDVQDLKSQCVAFMKTNLTVDTFCNTVTLAFQHLEKELLDLTVDFFAKHIQEIIVTAKWQSFVVENPVYGNEIMIKALVPNKK